MVPSGRAGTSKRSPVAGAGRNEKARQVLRLGRLAVEEGELMVSGRGGKSVASN